MIADDTIPFEINAELGPEGLTDAIIAETIRDRNERDKQYGRVVVYEVANSNESVII